MDCEQSQNDNLRNNSAPCMDQGRSNTWKKSTLKNVLVEYGMKESENRKPIVKKQVVIKDKPQQKQQQQQQLKKKETGKLLSFHEDADHERRNARRERNLQVFHEVQMLRDCYYEMYMTRLREKVDNQREEIRKKSQALENKIKSKEEQERRDSHRVKKRLERHDLNHNEDFVLKIPKSDYYKILALQNKLDSQGMLRTQEERDEFWRDVRKPQMLKRYMHTYKPLPEQPSGKPASISHSSNHKTSNDQNRSRTSSFSSTEKAQPDYRPMTQIEETREPSRPVTRETHSESPTRITGKDTPKKRELDPYTIAKLAAAELDRKCPQLELPPMSCFEMELVEDTVDPEEVLRDMDSERRRKERLLFVKRLRRMYHLSQSNSATAQRILSGQDKAIHSEDLHSPGIGDIIAVDQITQDVDVALGHIRLPEPPAEPRRPWTKHLVSPAATSHGINTIDEELSPSRNNSAKHSRATSAGSKMAKMPVAPIPLSLEALRKEDSTVMEPKCMSTLWTNYLHAGTSKFAPVAQS